MLEPLFALIRRRQPDGKTAVLDVDSGRARLVGKFPEPASDADRDAFRRRYIDKTIGNQNGPPSTGKCPIADAIWRDYQAHREVLGELVKLKRYRDQHGKDEHYERCKAEVWAKAFALVED